MTAPKIRIVKFESKTCGYCASMNKRRVVETIAEEFGADVVTLTIADEQGDSPEGTPYAEAYEISDLLGVQALPCYLVQDVNGIEFERIEGASSLTDFRKRVTAASEDMELSAQAFGRIEKLRAGVK
jgi:thioredoxin-related protein